MPTLSNTPPTRTAFNTLCTAWGWDAIALDRAAQALAASTLHVTATQGQETIAMGCVVGDGAMYFYLQDIVVTPKSPGPRPWPRNR